MQFVRRSDTCWLSFTAVMPSAELASLEDRIGERLPGVALESRVQGWAYLEEFQRGIEEYARIDRPTPADDRWLGVCHFQNFDDMMALEALYRAAERGAAGSHVNLAHLLRFMERVEEASHELSLVSHEELNHYDTVLYFRVKSQHEEHNGKLHDALRAAEEAWRKVQGLPEFPILAPSILSQVGILHGRIGRAQRALWFIDRAIQISSGQEEVKARIHRAKILVLLGRNTEAVNEVDSWDLSNAPAALLAWKHLILGDIAWATGKLKKATEEFEIAVQLAVDSQSGFEELLGRLGLVAILVAKKDNRRATVHLSRSQMLISDRSDRLNYRFREVVNLYSLGIYNAAHAVQELAYIAGDFGEMGLLQEQGWVRLHSTAIRHKNGEASVQEELDALEVLSVTLQNKSFLAREWALLPELFDLARKTHPSVTNHDRKSLELRTMGEEALLVNGERLNIPLSRTAELLAYFLEHKAASLRTVLADVFPDEKPRSAKSYYHQFRHKLKSAVPELSIEFDPDARLYRLKSDIDIIWDVAEIRAGKRRGDIGIFLPSSGSEWAQVLDSSLDDYRDF